MKVSSAKTLLQRQGFDPSDPLDDWLLAAWFQFITCHDWPFLTVETDITMTPGQLGIVTLPSNFVKVLSLRDDTFTKTTLEELDFRTFERNIEDPAEQGRPELYCTIGVSKLIVWRVPDMTINLHLIYMDKLSTWTADTDDLPGPVECHYPVVQIAKGIALQDENEEDRADKATTAADLAVERLWRMYSGLTSSDTQSQVQDVMGYMSWP